MGARPGGGGRFSKVKSLARREQPDILQWDDLYNRINDNYVKVHRVQFKLICSSMLHLRDATQES